MKLVIYLMFFMSTFTESNGMIQQNCNKKPLCFLCGCEDKKSVFTFNISCKNSHVIQMEPGGHLMRNEDSDDCSIDGYSKCKNDKTSSLTSLQDRIEVYKNCTLKHSCEINIKERIEPGKQRLVNYPFRCHNNSSIKDISSNLEEPSLSNPKFYFTGDKYTGQKIDCSCSVTGSIPLLIEIFFVNLKPSTCSKVQLFSESRQHLGCSTNDTTLLHIRYFYIGSEFKLEIRGMEPDEEDVLFFQVLGSKKLSVNCSGCSNSPDRPVTDATSTTTVRLSPTPAASTDQGDTVSTATWGGILAAVIIINIVGIALYCFLRHRKKQHKCRNTLANVNVSGNEPDYNYIDTNESNFINRTGNDVVPNGDQINSSDAGSLRNVPKYNQYHVLEVDNYSEPDNTRGDAGFKQSRGRKRDDYDHINDGSKSKPIINDTYNHIDTKMAVTRDATPSDDYNHIGDQSVLSKDKFQIGGGAKTKQERKQKNQVSGQETTLYVNVNMGSDEATLNTEDVDTYNHLQN